MTASRLPNFLYLGPPKAASSWLYEALSWHPEVFMPSTKELEYFSEYHHRGLPWYRKHFRAASDEHQVVGEVSVLYLYSDDAPRLIAETLPDVRLMVCLREPVDRAFSDYLHRVRTGRANGGFVGTLHEEADFIQQSCYSSFLDRYLATFGRERLHTAVFDDLQDDPQVFAQALFSYLGVHELALPSQLLERTLPAAKARSVFLGTLAFKGAQFARRAGMPSLVQSVKSWRPVQLALRHELRDDERPSVDPLVRAELMERFRPDVQRLDEMFGLGLTQRWGY